MNLTVAPCEHCGAAVPAARTRFCCAGCETVHEVLASAGLAEDYGRLLDRCGRDGVPSRPTDRGYGELDEPTFAEAHVRPAGRDGDLRAVELYLERVHCAACVWLVERLPRAVPGVVEARLDLGRGVATLVWDPARVALSAVARALDRFGYPPHPHRGVLARDRRRAEDRAALVRIAVAGAVAGNVMLLAFCLYGGAFAGMEAGFTAFFRWASLLLTVPTVLGPGRVFFQGARAALATRTLHMDLSIAIGISAAMAGGVVNVVRGAGEIWFDTVAVLIFLLLAGRFLERRSHRRAADAAELLASLAPGSARRLDGDRVTDVPIAALRRGDLVLVRPGDAFPVDGEVVDGRSDVDGSLLTGESRPRPVGPGEAVHAGTVNLGAPLRVRVVETGEATRVGKLSRLVDEAARRRAPIVRLADRIAGAFTATVLLLAALTLAGWWRAAGPALAIDHAVALLIITCPCALGLATPLAVSVAIGRAARAGVIVKGGDVLEKLVRPGRAWLDKTGTLTEGLAALVAWEPVPGQDEREARRLVLALEQQATHPLAHAIRTAWPGLDAPPCDEPPRRGAAGLEGVVLGRRVVVGSPRWVLERAGAADPVWLEARVAALLEAARTPVLVAVDGAVAGVLGFGDRVRDDARAALARLRARGWSVGILSGDHPAVVAAVGAELGLDPALCLGGVTPEEKVARVEASRRDGPVLMVGDGVNDAAALAAATVGVGVHGGAEATLAAADVFVTRPGLGAVADLVDGAHAALRTIRRNLAVSFFYNLIGGGLAIAGLIAPWMGALLMPFSSISVVTSSTWSRRSDPWR